MIAYSNAYRKALCIFQLLMLSVSYLRGNKCEIYRMAHFVLFSGAS